MPYSGIISKPLVIVSYDILQRSTWLLNGVKVGEQTRSGTLVSGSWYNMQSVTCKTGSRKTRGLAESPHEAPHCCVLEEYPTWTEVLVAGQGCLSGSVMIVNQGHSDWVFYSSAALPRIGEQECAA